MYHRCVFVLAALCATYSSAQPFEAVYGFANVSTSSGTTSPGPLPLIPGLSCGSFSAYGLAGNPNASGRFSFTGWPVGAGDGEDNYATFTAALSPFVYYELSVAPLPGFTLTLNSLTFYVRRSGTGVRNYSVRTSLDGFASNLSAGTGTNTNLQVIPEDVFFWRYDNTSTTSDQRGSEVVFGPGHKAITAETFIRIYAWNAEANNGTFSIDDVRLKGELVDSTLLSELAEHVPEQDQLEARAGCIYCSSEILTLHLYTVEGKLAGKWVDPPHVLAIPELEPGLYIALVKTLRGEWRQKLMLQQ